MATTNILRDNFVGGTKELSGHYYYYAKIKQEDRYVTTMKDILDHVGKTYKNRGDIWDKMDDEKLYEIQKPVNPADQFYDIITSSEKMTKTAREQVDFFENKIFKK